MLQERLTVKQSDGTYRLKAGVNKNIATQRLALLEDYIDSPRQQAALRLLDIHDAYHAKGEPADDVAWCDVQEVLDELMLDDDDRDALVEVLLDYGEAKEAAGLWRGAQLARDIET